MDKSAKRSSVSTRNERSLLDFHYAAQISIWLLKPMGVWPLDRKATVPEIITQRFLIIIVTFLQLFLIVPFFIKLITANWSFYRIIRTVCPLIFVNTVFMRYLLLLFHRNTIRSCINHVAEDWRNVIAEHREIMLTNAKAGRFFGLISVMFMFGSGLPFCVMPLILPREIDDNNITIRGLPDPNELIFLDNQISPIYEVVYVLEVFACCIFYTIFCGICSLMAKFVMHACGQCEILMYLFEQLIDGDDKNQDTVDQRFTNMVTHHLRIINFISDVDKVLNEICLAEFVNSSCNICLLGYYVIMDLRNQEPMLQIFVYFVAFASITFNIYIFCYIGEQLVDRYQKIGITCYQIEWYRLSYNKARCMIFPIIMSNYPIELTAGKMLKITMSSFSNILKISMTYFNLLREVSGRDAI